MKINKLTITYFTVSSRGLDKPKRFPAPCLPTLLNAPDLRISTDTEDEEIEKIGDARRSVNFGGRILCNSVLTYNESGDSGPQMSKEFPVKENFVTGCPICGTEDYKVRTRSRYSESTCINGHEYCYCPVCQKNNPGVQPKVMEELNGGRYAVVEVDLRGCSCKKEVATAKYIALAMYEDQPRRQPRNISEFDQGNPAQRPDIVVKVRRSRTRGPMEKFKGSKSKQSSIVWRTNEADVNPKNVDIPKSKILFAKSEL